MPQLLFVNPSPLKGKRVMAKKRRTAAQRAATKRMIAANRSRAGRKSSKPKRRRVARRANPAPLARRSAPRRARRSASRRVRRVARRRNPVGFVGDFVGQLVPSAVGAGGALALDVALGLLPLPDALKTGPMRPVARVAGAVALGMVAGMVTSKRVGNQVAAGALTVVLYDFAKGFLNRMVGGKIPGLSLYEMHGIGMYDVGESNVPLLPAPDDGMAYWDAGQQVGEYVNG